MNEAWHQRKSCSGKVRYSSRSLAKKARQNLKSSGRADGHLQAYACRYCDFWHLGHLSPDVFRGIIDKDAWRNR